MGKDKKPTMNQVKNAINNIVRELGSLFKITKGIDTTLLSYIDFKGDTDKFIKFLKKKQQEENGNKDTVPASTTENQDA